MSTLVNFGDMVTTDVIAPAGNIQKESPTGEHFMHHQIYLRIIILMVQEEEITKL